jgi:hypothetical protein
MEHAKHQGVNAMRAPYEILGTSENPCVGEVRKAYRALAKRWHPDRFAAGPEREWAGDRMADIQAGRENGLYTVAACYGYGIRDGDGGLAVDPPA